MPPKPNKDLNETLQSILDKLANLQTYIQNTHEHHENRYSRFHQTLENRQIALETKQESLTHTINTLLPAIPATLFSTQQNTPKSFSNFTILLETSTYTWTLFICVVSL